MTRTISTTHIDLKDIHFNALEWKSNLQFIKGELQFINQLFNSYVFEPTTRNLFERLQEFKDGVLRVEKEIEILEEEIKKHESELGGMLECDTISCDHYYYNKHQKLKITLDVFYKNYRRLKSEIFSYTGGVLKSNKKPVT
ncbi:hypothetical protein [Aquimarina pacifica]|uniref:hypothetical protein n=1 Tax=Aquimarina pacifica TaxID=1296415 RepID=UPI000472AA06|nr:hypothetical protein [Aquimarina pacifica]